MIYESMLELVGNTPLVRIRTDAEGRGAVFAKMEHLNPGGSIKDRICKAMIEDAEARGVLKRARDSRAPGPSGAAAGDEPAGIVVEPTSGNTGIGLAWVSAVKGYRCILTMPESMSLERRQLLEAYGAEIVLTPAEAQMDGAIARAKAIAASTPGAFMPHQFDNPANPDVHARTTAREILEAMSGLDIHAFVAGVGTGGTVSGVGRELRAAFPNVRVVAVEPESCATISRGERGPTKVQGLAAGFVPKNYDAAQVDEVRTVRDEDAWRAKQALAKKEGLLVGISSGATVHVSLALARELGPGKNVVTVLCDTGERYFSLEEHFAGVDA